MDQERQKKIMDKLREEERESVMMTGLAREKTYEFLIMKKGYTEEDIVVDMPVQVSTGLAGEPCSVDFVIRPGGEKPLVAIKCVVTALESSERHVLAFSRVAGDIPISVVTNSEASRVLRTKNGELLGESLAWLPGRAKAIEMARAHEPHIYPADRLDRECRILLAFNVLKCTMPDACPGSEGG